MSHPDRTASEQHPRRRPIAVARRGRAARVGGVALLAGCGPAPVPLAGTLALGGASGLDAQFTVLTDGQNAELIPGAQGGFHVWMKYRVSGLAAGRYHSTRSAFRVSDDKIVLRIPPDVVDVGEAGAGGYWESPSAVPMFMCPSPIGIDIVGERIRYQIDVLGDDGKPLATGTISLVPQCPDAPAETQAFCMRICRG